jgi:hypothetical protein
MRAVSAFVKSNIVFLGLALSQRPAMVACDEMHAKDRMLDINLGIKKDIVYIVYIDEAEAIAGIKRGLADVEAARVTLLEEFEKDFRKKHGTPRRSR